MTNQDTALCDHSANENKAVISTYFQCVQRRCRVVLEASSALAEQRV